MSMHLRMERINAFKAYINELEITDIDAIQTNDVFRRNKGVWILATDYWNDDGYWDDNDRWKPITPITPTGRYIFHKQFNSIADVTPTVESGVGVWSIEENGATAPEQGAGIQISKYSNSLIYTLPSPVPITYPLLIKICGHLTSPPRSVDTHDVLFKIEKKVITNGLEDNGGLSFGADFHSNAWTFSCQMNSAGFLVFASDTVENHPLMDDFVLEIVISKSGHITTTMNGNPWILEGDIHAGYLPEVVNQIIIGGQGLVGVHKVYYNQASWVCRELTVIDNYEL
jgi:hypothetical protein